MDRKIMNRKVKLAIALSMVCLGVAQALIPVEGSLVILNLWLIASIFILAK